MKSKKELDNYSKMKNQQYIKSKQWNPLKGLYVNVGRVKPKKRYSKV